MSLWAIEASRRSRSKLVPGTSRFVVDEMSQNLQVYHDGIQSVESSLQACALGLNNIIKGLNEGQPFSVLLAQVKDLVIPPEPPAEESMSTTYSALIEQTRAPKLLLSLGEKRSEPVDRHHHLHEEPVPDREHTPQPHVPQPLPVSPAPQAPQEVLVSPVPQEAAPTLELPERVSGHHAAQQPDQQAFSTHRPDPHPNASNSSHEHSVHTHDHSAHTATHSRPHSTPEASKPRTEPVEHSFKPSDALHARSRSPVTSDTRLPQAPQSPMVSSTPAPTPAEHLEPLPVAPKADYRPADLNQNVAPPVDESNKFSGGETAIGASSLPTLLHPSNYNRADATSAYTDTARFHLHPTTPFKPPSDDDQPQESSPNTNLSFIPVASTKAFGSSPSDTLFDAISTAIRKSFAGKLSLGRTIGSNSAEMPNSSETKIKQEKSLPHLAEPVTVRSRSFYEATKRSSMFVSLPKHEPIEYNNGHRSMAEVKTEEYGNVLRSARALDYSPAKPPARHEEPKRTANGQQQHQKLPDLFSDKSFFNIKAKLNADSRNTDETRHPLGSHRATAAGSPMGSAHMSKRAPEARNRSPVRASARVRASRSPLKQTQIESPSKQQRSNIEAPENDQKLSHRLTVPRNGSNDKDLRTRGAFQKNRFLSTTLDPENPPQIVASRKIPSPREKIGFLRAEVPNLRADSQYKQPSNVTTQAEPRQRQRVTISLSHKTDLRQNNKADIRESPTKVDLSTLPRQKRFAAIPDTNVAPRKRPVGNAVPLPDAARGIFKKELRMVKRTETVKEDITHIDRASQEFTPDALPEILSDDELSGKKQYFKSWAETPEIVRNATNKPEPDPVSIFGQMPQLNMAEIFQTTTAKRDK